MIWPFQRNRPFARDFRSCSGCGLCLLACPVWQQTGDIVLGPKGRTLALQGGATAAEVAESAAACVLCGSCMPACPERIDLIGMTLGLRADLAAAGRSPLAARAATLAGGGDAASRISTAGKTVLLAEPRLLADASTLAAAVGGLGGLRRVVVATDSGDDVAGRIESGLPIDRARLERFLQPLLAARRVVTADGFLYHGLRRWLRPGRAIGVGEAGLRTHAIRAGIRCTDLYVIEARTYHAEWPRLVGAYTRLRAERGCAMNLDLQRLAIPTAAPSLAAGAGPRAVHVREQVRRILGAHRVDRIVVESLDDAAAFRSECDLPVVHVLGIGAMPAPQPGPVTSLEGDAR